MINPIFKFSKFNIPFCANILVTGHKNPDADSIASAYAVANLLETLNHDPETKYIPVSPGQMSLEAQFIFNYFNLTPPKVREDLNLTVKEAMDKQDLTDASIEKDATIYEFISMIHNKQHVKTVAVLNNDRTVAGVVSRKSLAEFLIREIDHLKKLKDYNVSFETVSNLIDAKVITGESLLNETIEGDVQIGAYTLETTKKKGLDKAIVITGDLKDIQKTAINNGAKVLILAQNSPADNEIINLAKQNNVIILSTKHDIATVAGLLKQATPVSSIMSKNITSFNANQTVNRIANIVKNTTYSYFPVIEDGKFIGLISREDILNPDNNEVILVDHNNPSQSPDGINEKNIVGVYDHHMQELILRQKIYPISYSPVGATATIIAQTYRAKRLQIPPDIAGILMAAIISDTDNLKSSTTTDEDRVEVKHLAEIANIKDIDAFVEELLAQRDRALEGKTPAELIKFDMKSCGSVNISQIKVSNANQFVSDKQKYKEALNQLDSETSSKGSILMITDSNENATYLLVSDKMRKIAQKALEVGDSKILDTKIQDSTNDVRSSLETLKNEDSVLKLFNVHSRKKQIQPFVSQLIEMTNN